MPTKKKERRISVRYPNYRKRLRLKRAARLLGVTEADFVRSTLEARVDRILRSTEPKEARTS